MGQHSKLTLDRGQAGAGDQIINVFLVIVVATSIGFIGTDVTEEINDSTQISNNDTLKNANENISAGYADAMGITDIVFIVLMFGVILGVLLTFRVRTV